MRRSRVHARSLVLRLGGSAMLLKCGSAKDPRDTWRCETSRQPPHGGVTRAADPLLHARTRGHARGHALQLGSRSRELPAHEDRAHRAPRGRLGKLALLSGSVGRVTPTRVPPAVCTNRNRLLLRCRARAQRGYMVVHGSMHCLLVARVWTTNARKNPPRSKLVLDASECRSILANNAVNDAPDQGLSYATQTTPRVGVS
jgi:hypothetical protein